ncbi:MAG: polysaccharide biosynthesis tyrosine autokinase [Alphaproteobacteria bacterium]|nr:polysaccharide biosynthesis tyrosine autokinase [Alphaproteobacteria bacterium]
MADDGAAKKRFDLTQPLALTADDETGGLNRIIEAFRRRFWVFALVAAAVFTVVVLHTNTQPPRFTATANILLDVKRQNVLGNQVEQVFADLPPDTQSIMTETSILSSRALAARVVDALNLTADPEFAPQFEPSRMDRIRAFFGMSSPQPDPAVLRNIRREATIGAVMGRIAVTRQEMTYIINVSAWSFDPAKAARIANAVADNYLTMQLETKYETIATANQWLSNRLATLRDEVQQKERAVAEYRAANNLLAAGSTTLTEQAIAQNVSSLVAARAQLAAAQARLRGVAAGASSQEALQSGVVSSLRTRQADLFRQRAELSTRYGPRHPQMLEIDRQVEDLQRQIDAEIGRITENLRTEVRIAQSQVGSLEGSLGGQAATLTSNDVAAVRLRELERDADASRTLYEAFLNRFRQVAETSGIERADARIPSRATAPLGPSAPNKRLGMMLGLLLGVALGAIAVFIVELLERSLRTPEDVQNRVGVPCVGAVPFIDRRTRTVDGELLSPEDFVLKRPLSAFGEALRSVRAGVFFASPDRSVKVLAVTSALPDEGKTTTALGLARISALAGSRTVVVDCDLRRRSATHAMGLDVEKGLTEVLFRTASLNEVIQKDPGSNVEVVPLAQAEYTPRDLFGSEAMRSLIEALRARYDVVILDTAPVMPISDTRVLSSIADGVLIVARWGKTPGSMVRQAVERLRTHGAKICGVVLEGVSSGLLSRLVYDQNDYYNELYQTYYIR